MYSVVSAIGVPLGLNKRWETIDLAAYTVAQLFTRYRVAQITLLPQGSLIPVYLKLSSIAEQYSQYTGNFDSLLTSLGNTALPTTSTGLLLNPRSALFQDAFRAGYGVLPVDESNVEQPYMVNGEFQSVRLVSKHSPVDYSFFQSHCLVNVNGYYHTTSTDGTHGIFVKDAMKSLLISGQNQIGLLSFSNVASLSRIAITPSMLNTTVPTQPVVDLGVSLTGKSVLLSIGGYLTPVDNSVLTQVGSSSFKINFDQIDIVNRFYESMKYLDLSTIVSTTSSNPNQYVVADLTTPSAILAWLQMSQSFFIVVNCSELFVQTQYIKRTGIPNQYISYVEPLYPMVLTLGRQPPYWSIHEDTQYALNIYDNKVSNLLYDTVIDNPTVTEANLPGAPGLLQHAYLMQIGTDIR